MGSDHSSSQVFSKGSWGSKFQVSSLVLRNKARKLDIQTGSQNVGEDRKKEPKRGLFALSSSVP